MVDFITNGLGPAYRPFVRALEARIATVSFDGLYGLLLSEEMQNLQDEKHVDSLYATANFGQCRGRSSRGGRGGRGLHAPFGRNSYGNFGSSSNINYNLTCFTCQGYGHTCRQFPSGPVQSTPSTNVAATTPRAS